MSDRYPCPACGYLSFAEPPGSLARCPVCNWIDDHIQLEHPYLSQGMNSQSLYSYQRYFDLVRSKNAVVDLDRDASWKPVADRDQGLLPLHRWMLALQPPHPPYYWPASASVPADWPEKRLSRLVERRDVPSLLWISKDPDPEIAARAEEALRAILATLSAQETVRLNERLRRRFHHYRGDWPKELLDNQESSETIVALRSLHPSGYIRESAVKQLSSMTSGFEIPFLILRINDWVEPVRSAAQAALEDRLTEDCATDLVRALGLLSWLDSVGRTDNSELIGRVRALLQTPPFRAALEAGLEADDPVVRRESFRLLEIAPDVALVELADRGLSSVDTALRLRAARLVTARSADPAFRGLLLRMRFDRFTPVRRAAYEALLGAPDANPFLDAALTDPHPAVRRLGQTHARQASLDLASWYAARLASVKGRRLAAVVAGLGETGAKDKLGLLTEFLAHSLPSVRREALTSLSVLGHEATSDLALRALSDESGSVSRRAREILRRHRAAILPAQLWSIATGGGPLHGKRNALMAISSFGKWHSITYLVRAAASTEPKLAETAVLLLRRWIQTFNDSFATPTPDQVASLRTALAENEPRLPSELVENLRFLANSASTAGGNP